MNESILDAQQGLVMFAVPLALEALIVVLDSLAELIKWRKDLGQK